jgi:cytosine/adenosine deaminase-related metal-dependent hydrolase
MNSPKGSHSVENSRPVIHRAPWVVTGSYIDNSAGAGIVADGALVFSGNRIKAVGNYREIVKNFPGCQTLEHENRILAPPLINSHCHLELSYLDIAAKDGDKGTYRDHPTAWIRHLLKEKERLRAETNDLDEIVYARARQTLQILSREGVAFVGDIGNSLASRFIGQGQKTDVFFLFELLGMSAESETMALARLEEVSETQYSDVACTAHAPYSTTPAVIRRVKFEADRQGHVFSIHTAESRQEVEFLQSGSGDFREFLQERGAWDGTFTIPGKSSVLYLESLGVLNCRTICVHAVHVDNREVEILAKTRARVCLCPGSNRFLGVGKAPVTEFLHHGILPALGTDSLASNPVLSIWREMRLLRQDHPGLAPEIVFAMATIGGAEAWGLSDEMGRLEPGKVTHVLAVGCNDVSLKSGGDVFEYVTTVGESAQVEWLR